MMPYPRIISDTFQHNRDYAAEDGDKQDDVKGFARGRVGLEDDVVQTASGALRACFALRRVLTIDHG